MGHIAFDPDIKILDWLAMLISYLKVNHRLPDESRAGFQAQFHAVFCRLIADCTLPCTSGCEYGCQEQQIANDSQPEHR
jgi:hypothetical protein